MNARDVLLHTILCSDYKIFAKVIANRMREVLKEVIENDQQGFIKEGEILGNLVLVKEIIKYCEEENVDAALVLMDFEKAFDRVDREAMMSVLESMGFGEEFCSFIRTMYTDVEAQVMSMEKIQKAS